MWLAINCPVIGRYAPSCTHLKGFLSLLVKLYGIFCVLRSVHTWGQVAATNRFVCAGEFLWKSLSTQHNFVAATGRQKSNQTEFVRLVAATKLCCRDKDFHKKFPVHTKRFVAATCRRNVLLQPVDEPVHMEWSLAATCCCNLSPSVYRPLVCVCGSYGYWLCVTNRTPATLL